MSELARLSLSMISTVFDDVVSFLHVHVGAWQLNYFT